MRIGQMNDKTYFNFPFFYFSFSKMEVNCYSVTNLTHQLFALTVSEMETVYFHIEGDYGGKSISFT